MVANAITAKGVTTATDATFATMANNISKIIVNNNFTMVIRIIIAAGNAYEKYNNYIRDHVNMTKDVTIKMTNGSISITNSSGWSGYALSNTDSWIAVRLVSVSLVSFVFN